MNGVDRRLTLDAIRTIEEAQSVDSVTRALTGYVDFFGFKSVSIAQLVNPATAGKKRLLITDWPDEYVKLRIKENTFLKDPIVRLALKTKTPFTWHEAYERVDRAGRRILDQGREHSQQDGLLVPIHAFEATPGIVSLGTDKLDLSSDRIRWIDIVCVHAFTRITDLSGPYPFEIRATLSNREIDVIQYAAAGKTNWEIGKILSLSEYTVAEYLKGAAKKLNTNGRVHTVAVAIGRNLILA